MQRTNGIPPQGEAPHTSIEVPVQDSIQRTSNLFTAATTIIFSKLSDARDWFGGGRKNCEGSTQARLTEPLLPESPEIIPNTDRQSALRRIEDDINSDDFGSTVSREDRGMLVMTDSSSSNDNVSSRDVPNRASTANESVRESLTNLSSDSINLGPVANFFDKHNSPLTTILVLFVRDLLFISLTDYDFEKNKGRYDINPVPFTVAAMAITALCLEYIKKCTGKLNLQSFLINLAKRELQVFIFSLMISVDWPKIFNDTTSKDLSFNDSQVMGKIGSTALGLGAIASLIEITGALIIDSIKDKYNDEEVTCDMGMKDIIKNTCTYMLKYVTTFIAIFSWLSLVTHSKEEKPFTAASNVAFPMVLINAMLSTITYKFMQILDAKFNEAEV